jgi:hypothetical protein
MNPEQIENITALVLKSAEKHPLVFIELMARRMLQENSDEAIPQLAQASEDMGRWYEAHASALETEGRKRGNNVTPFPLNEEGNT